MSLQPGTRLGPYEVIAPAGQGGMGEVYRARDLRLQRVVAIKVLPPHVSGDADLQARFSREAETLASLSHPHICAVFDVGSEHGTDYLVMEYVEGQTLASRLDAGPLPLHEALAVAGQLAEALDAAHRHQIVHRDVKPGNVMLTRTGAKLLDFGLAKLTAARMTGAGSVVATGVAVTSVGQVLGTPQYMAPEQVEGREADARTDLFALGAVIYEMVTGHKAFDGRSPASVVAAILDREPAPMSGLSPATPAALERIVARCLAKDPDERWQTARDLGAVLQWLAAGDAHPESSHPATRHRTRWLIAWATLASVTAVILGVRLIGTRSEPSVPESIRFEVAATTGSDPTDIAIAPNGRSLAYTAFAGDGTSAIFVRDLGTGTTRQLAATGGGLDPFWDPNGRSLAFWSGGRLNRIDVAGGPPVTICEVENHGSGTWGREDTILFSSAGGLYRVSAGGGQPERITTLDESRQESAHLSPEFLPDGRAYVFLAWSTLPANRAIYLGELGSPARARLVAAQSKAQFAQPGYLLYHKDGVLLAHPIDLARRSMSGDPRPIVDRVAVVNISLTGNAAFAVSHTGTLAYRPGSGVVPEKEFVWLDRTGTPVQPPLAAGSYTANFDMTADGRVIAAARLDPGSGRYDIWRFDPSHTAPTRVTFDRFLSSNGNVVLSPDGRRIAFASERSGARDIYERQIDGTGGDILLLDTNLDVWPEDWTEDGRYLIYDANPGQGAPGDIYALPLSGDRKPISIVQSQHIDDEPRVSVDGRWMAYASNESGSLQVYAVAFPAGDRKRQVSLTGGTQPRWRRDGRELYYLTLDGTLMAVDVRADTVIETGTPHALFNARLVVDPIRDQFAVTGDGQRFLVQRPVGDRSSVIHVVTNWTSLLPQSR